MKPLPHQYCVTAHSQYDTDLTIAGDNLPNISSAAPADFGGPGDQWSPEDFLMAAVASCFILSFKAIAKASGFTWRQLHCEAKGSLDKVERTLAFTDIITSAKLTIDNHQGHSKAEKLLQKAEQHCLVVNSLSAHCSLDFTIEVITPD